MAKKKTQHFKDVDIERMLTNIVQRNTKTYHSDLSNDLKIFAEALNSKNSDDKFFLWFSRRNGTVCLKVRDVFISDSTAHTTLMYYGDSKGRNETYIAYFVEITEINNEKIIGNLHEVNFSKIYKDVSLKSVAYGSKKIIYEKGEKYVSDSTSFSYHDPDLGECIAFVDIPKEPELLETLLSEEKYKYCTY